MDSGEIAEETTFEEALLMQDEEIRRRGLRLFDISDLKVSDRLRKRDRREKISYEVEGVSVKLGGKKILDNINLKVDSNKSGIVGIIGANGTGKTTLAKAACGIIKKQTGKVKLNGKKLSVRECLKESYFVMQDVDYQLFTESVHDEMVLGRKLSEELEEKIEKSLEKLNLKAVTEHRING